jgi:hypothetical protein
VPTIPAIEAATGVESIGYGEKNYQVGKSATSSPHPIPLTTRKLSTHRSRRPPLKPLLASPRDVLQNKQRAISRDQHVQCSAADDHVACVLDHAGEEVGGSRWQAVSFYVGARAVGAVAENAFGRASGPAAFAGAWHVEGGADGGLREPGWWFLGVVCVGGVGADY